MEQNIDRYEIEKSLNAVNFSSIGSIAATGNGVLLTRYSFTDTKPFAGANYYRIRVTGKNGDVKFTNMIRIQLNPNKSGVAVYPNPVQGNRLTIELNNMDKGKYSVQLFNMKGQRIFDEQLDHQGGTATQSVLLSRVLPAGVYSLRMISEEKQFSQTIIAR